MEAAWRNWLNFHYGLECEEPHERFCNFVDPKNECYFNYWNDSDCCDIDDEPYTYTPECATRFKGLAGPHHHALIKAWYALHPWK
jgi:hypothetical protein